MVPFLAHPVVTWKRSTTFYHKIRTSNGR